MTKDQYLSELKRKLKPLPREERQNAVSYYAEFIEDAGPENEREVLEKLGPPEQLAVQVLLNAREDKKLTPRNPRKGLPAGWTIVMAIFAIPIGLPLALGAAALALGLALALGALALALALVFFSVELVLLAAGLSVTLGLIAAVVGLVAGGGFTAAIGLSLIVQHLPTALFFTGWGVTAMGLGGLLFLAVRPLPRLLWQGSRALVQWTATLCRRIFRRRERCA